MYYIPLHTDGVLSQQDLMRECPSGKWMPLLSLVPRANPAQAPLIPMFLSREACNRWCRRNVPKTWARGHYSVFPSDLERFRNEGWDFEIYHESRRVQRGWELVPQVFDIAHHDEIGIQGSYKGVFYEFNGDDPFAQP